MSQLVHHQHKAIRSFLAEVDRMVVLCEWARALLVRNGVPESKLTVSRHGLSQASRGTSSDAALRLPRQPLRVAFLGRLDETKGPDILIRALRSMPDAAVQLHLFGVDQGGRASQFVRHLHDLAAGDPRIAFLPPVPNERVVTLLRGYHVVGVPSRWLETGPLVVLEAFAAGIPVIGSQLGGIAELVEHGVSGLLVEPGSVDGWQEALRRLVEEPDLLARLRRGVRLPREMREVADEMAALYAELVGHAVGARESMLAGGVRARS
jgi:glycosyltransferase involved in cell wall biosynthesis